MSWPFMGISCFKLNVTQPHGTNNIANLPNLKIIGENVDIYCLQKCIHYQTTRLKVLSQQM